MQLERYQEIKSALAASDAGKSLAQTYRWGQFRNGESNKKWVDAIGMSAQVFSHGDLFYHLGETFLRYEDGRFTPEEQQTFLLGIAVHDIGEAKVDGTKYVGDVSAQHKTAKDEKKEVKVAYKAIDSLDVDDEFKARLLDAYKKVVEGGDPKLNFAFKALEKIEYIITAMKVYENGKIMESRGKRRIKNEDPLVGRVLVIDLGGKGLDMYIPQFPNSLGRLFKENAALIDEMFAATLPWLETHDSWGEDPVTHKPKPVDHKALADAFRVKWEAFKNS